MYRVGFLNPNSALTAAKYVEAFRDELQRRGYVEGKNVQIEYRYAEGQAGRLPALATELAQLKMNAIFAPTEPALLAVMKAACAAYFVDRILKGARPQDLPAEEPTRFEPVVNARAAAALKLPVPHEMLLLADEVLR